MMELFAPMTGFYSAIQDDTRIGTTHISLYMALLQQWNLNGGVNPVIITKAMIMKSAKISARSTFYKCMNNLQDFGYIIYLPSTNLSTNSTVYLKGL